MRLLTDQPVKITLSDYDGEKTFLVKMPSTEQRVSYFSEMAAVSVENVKAYEHRVLKAADIISGIGENEFSRVDENGVIVPISSNPESTNYYPEWKDLLIQAAPDLCAVLAVYIYESSVVKKNVQ